MLAPKQILGRIMRCGSFTLRIPQTLLKKRCRTYSSQIQQIRFVSTATAHDDEQILCITLPKFKDDAVASSTTTTTTTTATTTTTGTECPKVARMFEQINSGSKPASKKNIIGLSRSELRKEFAELGLEETRVKQIWHWIYTKGGTDFYDEESLKMKPSLRDLLHERYKVDFGAITADETSALDGTRKFLVQFNSNNNNNNAASISTNTNANKVEVECVYIPDRHEEHRGTMCLSSQCGCSLNCRFCYTGTQKFERNLTSGEIVGQFMLGRHAFSDFRKPHNQRKVTNIVFMGQGEPLYNFRNVKKAIEILTDHEEGGMALSRRKITLSTSGVVPLIHQVSYTGVNLAISLHATTNDVRSEIVPLNKTYPLEALFEALRTYPGLSWSKRITFEYVMLKGINDSMEDAKRLVKLVKQLPCCVNLIPFNPWPGSLYETSPESRILEFAQYLHENNIGAPIRWSRGKDILAACGQLKSTKESKQQQQQQQI